MSKDNRSTVWTTPRKMIVANVTSRPVSTVFELPATGKSCLASIKEREILRDLHGLTAVLFLLRLSGNIRLNVTMRKINTKDIAEVFYSSPKGKFGGGDKEISIALGRQPKSTDLRERHPFDVEVCRIPPGKAICPYHSHSAQWEFYHVISGNGVVRHADGSTEIAQNDAFIFEPGQPHKITNNGPTDLVMFIVADNPIGESCYYPDTNKCLVRSPESRLIRSDPVDYYDGEE